MCVSLCKDYPSSGVKSAHALRGIRLRQSKMILLSVFSDQSSASVINLQWHMLLSKWCLTCDTITVNIFSSKKDTPHLGPVSMEAQRLLTRCSVFVFDNGLVVFFCMTDEFEA